MLAFMELQVMPNIDLDEYQAILGGYRLNMGIAQTDEQLSKIYSLRKSVYQDEMSYLSSYDSVDKSSYHFYCRSGEKILASCRYTRPVNGEWESPQITRLSSLLPLEKSKLLQVGKFVIAPEYRGRMISEAFTWVCCSWLYRNTDYESLYAICSPILERFYLHFGGKSLANTEITIAERQNRNYRIIYGNFNTFKETLYNYLTVRNWSLISPYEENVQKSNSETTTSYDIPEFLIDKVIKNSYQENY
jgi:predicted GNAT family N-acyltransferase